MVVKMKKDLLAVYAQKAAFGAILLLVSIIGYSMLLFAMHIPMGVYSATVPAIGLLIYFFVFDREVFWGLLIDIAILIVFAIVCTHIFDWSYDGMYYHKEAIITLQKGWNPIYESCTRQEPLNENADLTLWLDNYPKGLWICSAAIYCLTHLLESAKAINIMFIVLLFGVALDTFITVFGQSKRKSIAFSALVCINPLFISQIFTTYNDLAVGVLVITTAFLGIRIYSEAANSYTYGTLFLVCAMSCLVKFTAPLLVGIVLIAYGIMYVLKVKGISVDLKKSAIAIFAGFFAGTLLFGYAPYTKHIIEGQNLVYPVLGENSYDIMNTNPPKGFEKKSGPEKYFISLFSKTSNDKEKGYTLKIPFSIHEDELKSLSNADIRLGGFGVWFSAILILSVLLTLIAIIRRKMYFGKEALILLVTFILLGLFFPESWWARYASYTYYIPIFLLFLVSQDRALKIPVLAIMLIILANSVFSAFYVVKDGLYMTNYLGEMLDSIKAKNKKIEIRINDFPSHLQMFYEKGIDFTISYTPIPDAIIFHGDTKYRFID